MQRFTLKHIEEANEVLHGIGLNVAGQQIEAGGRLGAQLSANQVAGGHIKFLSLHFDRRVHFIGDAMPGYVPFAVMRSGDSYYHGAASFGNDLCGFCNRVRSNTDVHWVGTMEIIYVPNLQIHYYFEQCGAHRALERMERFNNRPFFSTADSVAKKEYLRMHRLGLQGKIECDEQIMDMLLIIMNDQQGLNNPEFESMDFDRATVQAVVQAIRENSRERKKPLQLIDLLGLDAVTVQDTKLKKLMKANLHGLNALNYQKFCRLQELYLSLRAGEFGTVKEAIAAHRFRGFSIYGDFANFFGATPAEVLESAPVCIERYQTSEIGAVA